MFVLLHAAYKLNISKRHSKGSVSVESIDGRLRLRLPRQAYAGQQRYLVLGLEDGSVNRKIATAKALAIEIDLAANIFDPSLKKYIVKPKSLPAGCSSKQNLQWLFDQYVDFKTRYGASQSTIAIDYSRVQRILKNLELVEISQNNALFIRDWLLANHTPKLSRRILIQLSACCNWAIGSGIAEIINPFSSLVKLSYLKGLVKNNSEQICSFSREERDEIIKAFGCHPSYSFYQPLVKFLFFTGCRPSEAVALTWDDIHDGYINFQGAAVSSREGIVIQKQLKTQKNRRFPVNRQLLCLLETVDKTKTNFHKLVFPSPHGKLLSFRNFCQRAWKLVLAGLKIEYRPPYVCRHTFICLCLEEGVDVKSISQWVGNSPEIIYRHYVRNKTNLEVPEL